MKLKEQQKIQEDIYNENYDKYFNKNDFSAIKSFESEHNISYKKKSKYNKSFFIKEIYNASPYEQVTLLTFLKYNNNIYLVPNNFKELSENIIEEAIKHRRNLDEVYKYSIIESGIKQLRNLLDLGAQNYEGFIKHKNNDLLKKLIKQQIFVTFSLQNFYLKKFIEIFNGEDNLIKFFNNELSYKKLENEIFNNFIKNLYIFSYQENPIKIVESQFNRNKDRDVDNLIPDKIYNLYISKIHNTPRITLNVMNISDEIVEIFSKYAYIKDNNLKIKGFNKSKNKIIIRTKNKVNLLNQLKEDSVILDHVIKDIFIKDKCKKNDDLIF